MIIYLLSKGRTHSTSQSVGVKRLGKRLEMVGHWPLDLGLTRGLRELETSDWVAIGFLHSTRPMAVSSESSSAKRREMLLYYVVRWLGQEGDWLTLSKPLRHRQCSKAQQALFYGYHCNYHAWHGMLHVQFMHLYRLFCQPFEGLRA